MTTSDRTIVSTALTTERVKVSMNCGIGQDSAIGLEAERVPDGEERNAVRWRPVA